MLDKNDMKMLNNPVPVSLLSGDRKPQIRFLGNQAKTYCLNCDEHVIYCS